MKIWIDICAMFYLGILSVKDMKRGLLSVNLLLEGAAVSILIALGRIITEGRSWEELVFGALPGIVLLMVSQVTKSVGIGDGIVLLQTDLLFFMDHTIMAFGISMCVVAIYAAALLLFRKSTKHTRIPYIPFLWIGCGIALAV